MNWKEYLNCTKYWNKNASWDDCWDDCLKITKDVITDYTKCYDLSERPLWQLYGHAIVIGIIILVSLFGNCLFLILFSRHRSLRNRTTIISSVIILVNTAKIFTFHFPVLVSAISAKWIFSCTGCQIFGFLMNGFFLTYWLFMGALAFDRFCMVHFPCYLKRSKCILVSLIVASWVIPLLVSTITVDEYSEVVFRQNIPTCIPHYPKDSKAKWLSFIIGVFASLTGGAIPLFLYIILLWKAVKFWHSKKAAAKGRNNKREETIEPHVLNALQICDTFALIFLVSCVVEIPSVLFLMVRWISTTAWCDIPYEIQFMAAELLTSSTAITPFLIMKEKNFKRNIKLLLLHCCKRNKGSATHEENASAAASAAPRRSINFLSFISSEGQWHHDASGASSPHRARSSSFPVAARHKIYASSDSRGCSDSRNLYEEGMQDSFSPDLSPSSYGVEEVKNIALHVL